MTGPASVPSTPATEMLRPHPAQPIAGQDPEATATPLSVGLLLDSAVQEGWVADALRHVLSPRGVKLTSAVVLQGIARHRFAERLQRSLESYERWLRCRSEPLFHQVDIPVTFSWPVIEVAVTCDADGWFVEGDSLEALRACGVDLWLCFTAVAPRRPLPALASGGVWGLEIGAVPASNPWAGATEVGARAPMTPVRLVDYSAAMQSSHCRAHCATVRNSLCNNRLSGLRKGLGFFRWVMNDPPGAENTSPEAKLAPAPTPTVGAVARGAWQAASTVAGNRLRSAAFVDQWQIGYHFTDNRSADARWLHYLAPPTDRFWADPFAVERQGRHFVFFEELKYREQKGRILVMELFEHREPDPPRLVLEKPYHLSYPFVFQWQGKHYLLPESAENRTVELYRCETFPDRWVLHKVLLEGLSAYDATLWQDGDRWWMFATVAPYGNEGNDELHLYSSDSPLGPWNPHRRNPVVTDLRYARSAGPLYTRDGVLYRPSQDCSITYGYSVVVNRIDALDDDEYRQVPVSRISPDWGPKIRRVHTVGAAGRLRVLDCQVRRLRSPRGPLRGRIREWLDWTTHPLSGRGGV